MKHTKIYGIALIIGALGGIVTMALHPTGHDILQNPEEISRRYEMLAVAVHTLAIISVPIMFWGFFGFSQRIGWEKPTIILAQIAFGFGSLSVTAAAVINGLATPTLMRQIYNADEPTKKLLNQIVWNNWLLNQAFSKVYVVATAAALIIWSYHLWKKGLLAQITAVIGFIIGVVSLLGIFSGHLKLDVHGFGLVMFGQAVWIILVAIFMLRSKAKEWIYPANSTNRRE
jgi:hypothetical protein